MLKIDPYRSYKTNQAGQRRTPQKESSSFAAFLGAEKANVDRLDISAGHLPTELEKTAATMARTVASPASEQRRDLLPHHGRAGGGRCLLEGAVMAQAYGEYQDFLSEYARFLEEMARNEQEKYAALLSFDAERMTKTVASLQSSIMQLDQMEAKRIALQEKAGFGSLTFSQLIAQLQPEERPEMEELLGRIQRAVWQIKFMNEKALAFAREGLASMTPEHGFTGQNLYAPPGHGRPGAAAAQSGAVFESEI